MKITKLTLLFLTLALAGQNSLAADKLRVLDRGLDGNQRSYLITCPGGGYGSVIQTFDIPTTAPAKAPPSPDVIAGGGRATKPHVTRVCIQTSDGQEICRGSWNLDDAARASCK